MKTKVPSLYVVATPIGNLSEMTPRAIEIMKQVAWIASEDTRETHKLCEHFDIATPLVACHEHNEFEMAKKIVQDITNGQDVALVSDAGYPGISDPGYLVIQEVVKAALPVIVISGASAFLNGLIGSGLPTDHFYFHGFLPSRKSDRKKILDDLKTKTETLVFYEAPHRIIDMLEDVQTVFGDRQISIARELTKLFEEYIRGTVSTIIEKIKDRELKGEMVVVVQGHEKEDRITLSHDQIVDEINKLIENGKTAKDAIKEVADTYNLPKNEVYRLFHQ